MEPRDALASRRWRVVLAESVALEAGTLLDPVRGSFRLGEDGAALLHGLVRRAEALPRSGSEERAFLARLNALHLVEVAPEREEARVWPRRRPRDLRCRRWELSRSPGHALRTVATALVEHLWSRPLAWLAFLALSAIVARAFDAMPVLLGASGVLAFALHEAGHALFAAGRLRGFVATARTGVLICARTEGAPPALRAAFFGAGPLLPAALGLALLAARPPLSDAALLAIAAPWIGQLVFLLPLFADGRGLLAWRSA